VHFISLRPNVMADRRLVFSCIAVFVCGLQTLVAGICHGLSLGRVLRATVTGTLPQHDIAYSTFPASHQPHPLNDPHNILSGYELIAESNDINRNTIPTYIPRPVSQDPSRIASTLILHSKGDHIQQPAVIYVDDPYPEFEFTIDLSVGIERA